MKRSYAALVLAFWGLASLALCGCGAPAVSVSVNPIVGAWVVRDPDAPFPYHMYVFNADGTMQQANPDAGDPRSSDSDGKGVWVTDGGRIKGKWVEIIADRATHKFTGRAEISFEVAVTGDTFTGTVTARSYAASDTLPEGPTKPTALDGKRVRL